MTYLPTVPIAFLRFYNVFGWASQFKVGHAVVGFARQFTVLMVRQDWKSDGGEVPEWGGKVFIYEPVRPE